MAERLLLGDVSSNLNQGAPSSEWTVNYLDARLGIVPEETHLETMAPEVYASLTKYRPLKRRVFETRGQYEPKRMNQLVEHFWTMDNDQENFIRTSCQVKNFERYLREGVFPRIVERMEWVLDETQWPNSRECFKMLTEMVSCHPDCDTDHWKSIELYLKN